MMMAPVANTHSICSSGRVSRVTRCESMSLVANERAVSRPEMIVNTAPVYLTHSAGLPVAGPDPEPRCTPAPPSVRVRRWCVDDGDEVLVAQRQGNDERQLQATVAGEVAAGCPRRSTSSKCSRSASDAPHDTGSPTHVEQRSLGSNASANSKREIKAQSGQPSVMPFDMHMPSGSTSQCSMVSILPPHPEPLSTSSAMN